jgi:hypothetical protein
LNILGGFGGYGMCIVFALKLCGHRQTVEFILGSWVLAENRWWRERFHAYFVFFSPVSLFGRARKNRYFSTDKRQGRP